MLKKSMGEKEVSIGSHFFVKQAGGNLRECYTLSNPRNEDKYRINGYYFVGGKNDTEICFTK